MFSTMPLFTVPANHAVIPDEEGMRSDSSYIRRLSYTVVAEEETLVDV
jgi:hypothetical protein